MLLLLYYVIAITILVRPQVCRGFYCGWFFLEELDDTWHPERSGVVIRSESFNNDTITILVLHFNGWLRYHNLEWLVLVLAVTVFPAVLYL